MFSYSLLSLHTCLIVLPTAYKLYCIIEVFMYVTTIGKTYYRTPSYVLVQLHPESSEMQIRSKLKFDGPPEEVQHASRNTDSVYLFCHHTQYKKGST